jgi:hypothetical protein
LGKIVGELRKIAAVGTNAADWLESELEPISLFALTVNRYDTPAESPLTPHEVAGLVAVHPRVGSPTTDTVYELTSPLGAVQLTLVFVLSMPLATTAVGACGAAVAALAELEAIGLNGEMRATDAMIAPTRRWLRER